MPIAKAVPPRFTLSEAKQIAQEIFGIQTDSIKDLGSYIDQNLLLTDTGGQQYLLKIHDQAEKRAVLELQNAVMHFLEGKAGDVQFPQVYPSLNGDECPSAMDAKGEAHCVRLLHFLPGALLKDIAQFNVPLLTDIGRTVGQMDHALVGFDHPAANRADLPWDLKNAGRTGQLSRYIADPHQRRLAEFFLMKFDVEVEPCCEICV